MDEHGVEHRRNAGVRGDPDQAIHEDEAGNVRGAEALDQPQHLHHTEGPADQDHVLCPEVAHELVNILGATIDEIPLADPVGRALRAGVQGDDAVGPNEVPELRLPDFSRHGPTRHEDDRGTGSSAEVVEPDAIAGDEPLIGQSGRGRRLGVARDSGGQREQQAQRPEANQRRPMHGRQRTRLKVTERRCSDRSDASTNCKARKRRSASTRTARR